MITNSVRGFLEQNNISNCNITVALSGGKDSVSLLIALLQLKDEFSLCITAAHLNHNLRGEESQRDENYVKDLCEKLGVHLYLESINVQDIAKNQHKGIEETARQCRYDFLIRVSPEYIATAHNKEDNAETVLLNIIRGTGIQGLCGIDSTQVRLIRPLLSVSKKDIIEYLSTENIDFVTDSTNADITYSRNRVRNVIIPEAEKINQGSVDAILRLSNIAREYEEHIIYEAKEIISRSKTEDGYSTDIIKKADVCLRKKIISLIIAEHIKQNISHLHITMADNLLETEGKLNLPENLFFTVKNGIIKIEQPASTEEYSFCYPFDMQSKNYGDFSVSCTAMDNSEFQEFKKVNNLAKFILLDCDKIPNDLYFRSKIEGDIFCPFGRSKKTLKKHFIDEKIPLAMRSRMAVLVSDKEIIGVEGLGASADYGVTEKTNKIIKIEIIRQETDKC